MLTIPDIGHGHLSLSSIEPMDDNNVLFIRIPATVPQRDLGSQVDLFPVGRFAKTGVTQMRSEKEFLKIHRSLLFY